MGSGMQDWSDTSRFPGLMGAHRSTKVFAIRGHRKDGKVGVLNCNSLFSCVRDGSLKKDIKNVYRYALHNTVTVSGLVVGEEPRSAPKIRILGESRRYGRFVLWGSWFFADRRNPDSALGSEKIPEL